MIFPPHHARPYGLPIRLVLGGAAMASLYLLSQGGFALDVTKTLLGLSPASGRTTTATISVFACARTWIVISIALVTAYAAAIMILSFTRQICPKLTRLLSVLGWLLFATPILGLVWTWAGWWIGTCGGVIETILPPHPHDIGEPLSEWVARQVWTWLAPILALAIPLTGLLIGRFSASLHLASAGMLANHLRAQGFSPARLFDRHLIPLFWPGWHRRLESSLMTVLVLDITVESALQFPGWGNGFVNALQTQNAPAIAFGLHTTGLLAALLCATLGLIRPRSSSPSTPDVSSRFNSSILETVIVVTIVLTISFFLCLDVSSPLHLQNTRLDSGESWLPALKSDGLACIQIIGLALIGGPILAALRLTILGDWLRRYGSLETLIWSPLPIWAVVWSHTSGQVIGIDLSFAVLASITLSIHIYSSTRRHCSSPLFEASRTLGATSWQIWQRHAMRPWLMELTAVLFSLLGSVWWLRIFSHSLLPSDKMDPTASIGCFLAKAASDAIHHPLPLLSASLATAVSILFLWSLGRIIHPTYLDDA